MGRYSQFKYIVPVTVWFAEGLKSFGFAVNGEPDAMPYPTPKAAESAARAMIKTMVKSAREQGTALDARLIKS